jgi:sterol desaturase/sphingolipid hydroxylase (fatty acid hydroxylase superfamily)
MSRSILRSFVRYAFCPIALFGAVALTYALPRFGIPILVGFNVVLIVLAVSILGLEQVVPLEKKWNSPDGLFLQDIGHTLVGTGFGGFLGQLVVTLVIESTTVLVIRHFGISRSSLWPHSWPIAGQIILVFLIADFGRYWQHRAHHAWATLWSFHSLHHNTERMSAIKASRSHFFERVLQQVCMFAPLSILGATPEAVTFYIFSNSFLGLFDHSNLDVSFGPLRLIFTAPRAHLLHHSQDEYEGRKNFGSALAIWDIVFGTFVDADDRKPPGKLGIANDQTPAGFLAQAFAPWVRPARRKPAP